jgi:hypothetical protein
VIGGFGSAIGKYGTVSLSGPWSRQQAQDVYGKGILTFAHIPLPTGGAYAVIVEIVLSEVQRIGLRHKLVNEEILN